MNDRVYLDWNATTPLRPEARTAMRAAMDLCGNPSSVHSEGRLAHRLLQEARAEVAAAVGARCGADVVFTSGATEANVLALSPGLHIDRAPPLERLVVSAIEHASVLDGGRFGKARVELAGVSRAGVIDLDRLDALLTGRPPALVSVMLANNETGAIQPVRDVARMVHEAGGLVHVDAVAAFGRIEVNFNELDADLLSISAHKVGGPKGVGALVVADRVRGLEPLLRGGGQEKGRRAGTENLIGIAGFGAAARAVAGRFAEETGRYAMLQRQLEDGLAAEGAMIFAADAPRIANTTLFSAPGLRAETAVIGFDLEGIAVSSGSACSSGKVQPSHVLAAMGTAPELIGGGVRISFGWDTSENDVNRAIRAWRKLSATLVKRDHETVVERF